MYRTTLLLLGACTATPTAPAAVLAVDRTRVELTAELGAHADAVVHVTNIGDAASGSIAVAVTRSELTAAGCAVALAPGDGCDVTVEYAPTRVDSAMVELVVHASPGGDLVVELAATTTRPALAFDAASLDLGAIEIGTHGHAAVVLRNAGDGAAAIDAIDATGGFVVDPSACGTTLAPGATCAIDVGASPAAFGPMAGTLAVTSGSTKLSVPLSAAGGYRVDVTLAGSGSGTVTSFPAGIDCGTTCSAVFAEGVGLEAASATSSVTWSVPGCLPNAQACGFMPTGPTAITATFTPAGPTVLALALTGDATGEVDVYDRDLGTDLAVCTSSCEVPVVAGHLLDVTAATPSHFDGMTGACQFADGEDCQFVAMPGTNAASVGFHRDPSELFSILVGSDAFTSVAMDSHDNVVVGGSVIVELSPSGDVVWSLPLAPCVVAAAPGDAFYAQTAGQLVRINPDGTIAWSATLPPEAAGCGSDLMNVPQGLAVAPDGSVVVRAGGLARWDATGTMLWAIAAGDGEAYRGVAIEPDGTIDVAIRTGGFQGITVERHAPADGAVLPGPTEISGNHRGMFVVDAAGRFIASDSDAGYTTLYATTVGGDLLYTVSVAAPIDESENGVCLTGAGFGWLTYDDFDGFYGGSVGAWTLRRVDASGALRSASAQAGTGTGVYNLAGSPSGRIALAGVFDDVAGNPHGWIRVYAAP